MLNLRCMLWMILCFASCWGVEPKEDWLLIVGCGRSGTEFMTTFLRESGRDVGHERPAYEGCVSWPMLADLYSPWGPSCDRHKFTHVFHQVRNPLHVITSWYTNLKNLDSDEWILIRENVPEMSREDSLIVHCAKYWYYWNLKAEAMAEWRYRVEDLNKVLFEFKKRLDWDLYLSILQRIPKNKNSWASTQNKIKWADLKEALPEDLFMNIRSMALRYGYPVVDQPRKR